MESILDLARDGVELTPEQCAFAVEQLADETVEAGSKEIFLERLHCRGETAREIASFARALVSRATDTGIVLGALPGPALDVCGTGGDRLELFNISTTAMFVLAAGGAVVIKHGNRAVTSQCGGADVLEELGVRIECGPERLRACVQEAGLGFVFAPAYHPAFKVIGPVRRALAARGIPSVFNLLGPLLNPVQPPFQLVGVYSSELLPKYAAALHYMGRTRAWAVHGAGADELTCAGGSEVVCVSGVEISEFQIVPETAGLLRAPLAELRGGDRVRNAGLLRDILSGTEKGAPRDAVLLNAAAGFVIAGLEADLKGGVERARRALDEGQALRKLELLCRISRGER